MAASGMNGKHGKHLGLDFLFKLQKNSKSVNLEVIYAKCNYV